MKLCSKYRGEINYEEEDIINFPNGLPGFEKLKKFIILKLDEIQEFSILQSIENAEIGLIITNPFLFDKEYEVNLPDGIISYLKINVPEQAGIYTTVTLNSNINKITSNLRAPIIINKEFKLGQQYIMDSSKYSLRYPLLKKEAQC